MREGEERGGGRTGREEIGVEERGEEERGDRSRGEEELRGCSLVQNQLTFTLNRQTL